MKTNEALIMIERWQKQLCYVCQSLVTRTNPVFKPEVIAKIKSETTQAILDLGALRQEIYRFIQDNPATNLKCEYSADKPISNSTDIAEIVGASYRLSNLLAVAKNEILGITQYGLISGANNRKYQVGGEYKKIEKNFSTCVDNLYSIVDDWKANVVELPVEEPKKVIVRKPEIEDTGDNVISL